MRALSAPRSLCASLLFAFVAAAPAAASTYVPVSDAAMVDRAALVAEVTVEVVGMQTDAGEAGGPEPWTDYTLRLDRLVLGPAPRRPFIVRVPGSLGARTAAVLWGAPQLNLGDRLLLFLTPRADGTWNLLHLGLGAFHLVETKSGETVALRDLAGAAAVRPRAGGRFEARVEEDRPRDSERFVAWIAARAAGDGGEESAADYFVELDPAELRSVREKFTLFAVGRSNLRWFEFDRGQSVPFFAQAAGQPGLAGGGFAELQASLAAWNGDPATNVDLAYAGTTPTAGTLGSNNGINEITFDDPSNEITPFDCAHGGFLAFTFTFGAVSQPQTFRGLPFIPITGSHIVTAKNISCFLNSGGTAVSPASLTESLFTHELGHTLGLDHSCGDFGSGPCDDPVLNDAIMRSFVQTDGRGARLGKDDQAALRLLYSTLPVAAERCANDLHTLCLGKRFTVQVDWFNPFDGSSGIGRAIPSSTQAGFFSFGDPGNVELLIKAIDFGNVTKVFYGELTNLDFLITVRDTLVHEARVYTNTKGDCGGIDQSAFAGVTVEPKAGGGCRPSRNTLCLLKGRFAVTVDWANPGNGTSGAGNATRLSDLVGTFFWSDPGNVELMTKLIDLGDRIAFFYGALSDLPYTLHVRDTATGQEKVYQSAAGKLCGGLDNHAF